MVFRIVKINKAFKVHIYKALYLKQHIQQLVLWPERKVVNNITSFHRLQWFPN